MRSNSFLSISTIASIVSFCLAIPLTESAIGLDIVRPRNHIVCDSSGRSCSSLQTCDNNPSLIVGTVPSPYPSTNTRPQISPAIPIGSALPTSSSASSASASASTLPQTSISKNKKRQQTPVQWCALGTPVYILLAVQGFTNGATIKATLDDALAQLENYTANLTLAEAKTAIKADTTAPVYNYTVPSAGAPVVVGTPELTAYNAMGANLSWYELEYTLLTVVDWMDGSGYGWGSASVYDGADEVGMIYITP